ncbi:hypothetical protein [Schaalia vaccimaxillae]|uniref:hypothetical protein n=1 Tax=Schaalia vaccimaxillae TaxID=183916 RepID=UPI00047C3CF1|nr:hypothetical protein [Schaalia vaccimaxillae]
MSLNASTLATALDAAAEEASRLAPFLNDLDGWNGSDCDTGSNAHLTLLAMAVSLRSMDPRSSFAAALDVAVDSGIRQGVGHVGILLTGLMATWAHALESEPAQLTPIAIRRMLSASAADEFFRIDASTAVHEMLTSARTELADMGQTLLDEADVVSRFSSQAQVGLIEATNEHTGRIDAGGAVLALVLTCLDCAIRQDAGMLESLAQMLADLAQTTEAGTPAPQTPPAGRDFTVDIIWQGGSDGLTELVANLCSLGARLSYVGRVDLFGLGEWRLHVDTAAPLAILPRTGRTLRFQVADARPDDQIGVDDLADEGLTHRGIRLLQRRPMRRVERARVIACTRAPGIIEDMARAGAIVFYDPQPQDAPGLWQAAASSSTGITLIAPCDEASAQLASVVAPMVPAVSGKDGSVHPGLLIAETTDDLSVLLVSQACAPLFVPQPGGREVAATMLTMLRDTAHLATSDSVITRIPDDLDQSVTAQAVAMIRAAGSTRCKILLNRECDGPLVTATLRQLLGFDAPSVVDLEVRDGGHHGPTLLQGLG